MQTKSYQTIDKSDWPRGEWDGEPDKVQWQDEETGLPCVAIRNDTLGHWCGYVGLPSGHPGFRKDYDDEVFDGIDVHWGLTYASETRPEYDGIADHWIVGFDCAHLNDLLPGTLRRYGSGAEDTYRNLRFVQSECRKLAAQLKEMAA